MLHVLRTWARAHAPPGAQLPDPQFFDTKISAEGSSAAQVVWEDTTREPARTAGLDQPQNALRASGRDALLGTKPERVASRGSLTHT